VSEVEKVENVLGKLLLGSERVKGDGPTKYLDLELNEILGNF